HRHLARALGRRAADARRGHPRGRARPQARPVDRPDPRAGRRARARRVRGGCAPRGAPRAGGPGQARSDGGRRAAGPRREAAHRVPLRARAVGRVLHVRRRLGRRGARRGTRGDRRLARGRARRHAPAQRRGPRQGGPRRDPHDDQGARVRRRGRRAAHPAPRCRKHPRGPGAAHRRHARLPGAGLRARDRRGPRRARGRALRRGRPVTALRAAPAVAAEPAVDLPRRARTRVVVLFVVLAVALLGCAVLAAGSGQLSIPAGEVVSSVLHRLGLGGAQVASHANGEAALWTIRFPRVAMALLVGAALATAGALMQGVFGNPLAEPGVAGVSSGAALAACAAIALGWTFLGPWTTSAVAFAGGLAATLVVYLLSRSGGRTEVVTLILTGVAINAIAGAGIAFL